MSNKDNREKSNQSFSWFYWLIGLLILKLIFPAVANVMNKPTQKQLQLERKLDTLKKQYTNEYQQAP